MIVICVFFSLTLYTSGEKECKNKSTDFPSCFGLIQVQNSQKLFGNVGGQRNVDLVDRLTVWRCRGLSADEETSCYKEKVNENPNNGKSLLQTKSELVNLPGQKVTFHLPRLERSRKARSRSRKKNLHQSYFKSD